MHEKTRSFASGKELKKAMGRAGVRGKPEIGFAVGVPQVSQTAPPPRQTCARAVPSRPIPRHPRPNLAILVC